MSPRAARSLQITALLAFGALVFVPSRSYAKASGPFLIYGPPVLDLALIPVAAAAGAFALSEPGAGSDPGGARQRLKGRERHRRKRGVA